MPRTSVTATTYGSDRRKRQAMSRSSARSAVIARSRGAAPYSRRGELKTVDVNYGQITLNATQSSVTTPNIVTGKLLLQPYWKQSDTCVYRLGYPCF